MDHVAARLDGMLHHLEDQGVGSRQMLKIARASVYAQIVLGMAGSLAFVYGTIHSSALALSLYAVVALEIKAPRLLKIYAVLLLVLTLIDFFWLATYAGPIGSSNTGMVMTLDAGKVDVDRTLKWGIMASGVNNFFCLVPEIFAFFLRIASVLLWALMWSKGLLDGSDGELYADPNSAYETVHKHSSIPGSPARNGVRNSDAFFTGDGGYQDIEA
ncbi:unnamed product [Ostreococcus tauri]|uniref:Unnamed product n=1 Tax=Ostreococcus tauri TaxID=70448 RepID=Q01G97_OSTTA|nr:unnamed product [Ostreococcus tauri]CAL50247.1 unnamed product [Ostreococcus tauri]|eukprot:XP_003074396.1 unnamed product [Ostreococcus tauri]